MHLPLAFGTVFHFLFAASPCTQYGARLWCEEELSPFSVWKLFCKLQIANAKCLWLFRATIVVILPKLLLN
uniref:GEO11567p1 n=1 Tax=Drosophila melanogaster TaxID=7227 RepID=Q8IPL6_DROME